MFRLLHLLLTVAGVSSVYVPLSNTYPYEVGDIKHFLVLFMENRAFDHIFGCSADELPGIDGVKPGMGNWIDPNDHSKGFVEVECGKAEYVCKHGVDHSFPGTTDKIFGPGKTTGAKAPYPPVTMGGFANHSAKKGYNAMRAFNASQLPVKIALAKEFALFNNFYAAIPGPSQPNHMFAQSGTSCGVTETGVAWNHCGGKWPLFPQKTIYDTLMEAGKDFAVYYNGTIKEGGVPGDIYMSGLLKNLKGRAHTFDAPNGTGFFAQAANGTLPAFSWVLPRNGGLHPNDDHPCHDVALGEELLKSVYEALRAGPAWNETALFVVYDDNGGFFDHVPTPLYAPPPNTACDKVNTGCPDTFAFDRLGPRLANLLISPRVPRGAVFHDPAMRPGQSKANASKFDLASVAATVKNLFGLDSFLTDRDAWSGSFHETMLGAPRTDAPMHLPDAPPPTQNVATVHGCGSPQVATRRQRRHHELLDTILTEYGKGAGTGKAEAGAGAGGATGSVAGSAAAKPVWSVLRDDEARRRSADGDDDDDDDDNDGGDGDDGDDDDNDNHTDDDDDDDDDNVPYLGENTFIWSKGFAEMKGVIAKKAQALLDGLADGSVAITNDEL